MIEKLKEWLDKQGYPLEMKVATELLNNDFQPLQSNYYIDPQSEKHREIDVVGQIGFTLNGHNIFFKLIVECKNNIAKPWITFSSNSHIVSEKNFLTQRPSTGIGRSYLDYLYDNNLFDEADYFKRPSSFAYNATQAFETESDKVYSAMMSIVNATMYRRDKLNSDLKYNKYCEIYFPIIVLGGKLFDCHLDESNEMKVLEVDHKILLWKNNVLGGGNAIIEISTFNSFKERLKKLKNDIDTILMEKATDFFSINRSNISFGSL